MSEQNYTNVHYLTQRSEGNTNEILRNLQNQRRYHQISNFLLT